MKHVRRRTRFQQHRDASCHQFFFPRKARRRRKITPFWRKHYGNMHHRMYVIRIYFWWLMNVECFVKLPDVRRKFSSCSWPSEQHVTFSAGMFVLYSTCCISRISPRFQPPQNLLTPHIDSEVGSRLCTWTSLSAQALQLHPQKKKEGVFQFLSDRHLSWLRTFVICFSPSTSITL